MAGSPLVPLVLWFQLSRGASRGSERVMRFPQSTNPGLSGPQAVLLAAVPRGPAPRQARPGQARGPGGRGGGQRAGLAPRGGRGPLTFSLLLLQEGRRLGDAVRDGRDGRGGVHGCGDRERDRAEAGVRPVGGAGGAGAGPRWSWEGGGACPRRRAGLGEGPRHREE